MKKKYILVTFPEIQYFMEHERWDECIAGVDGNRFVPEDLYNEVINNLNK